MVTLHKVELGEPGGTAQLIEELVNCRVRETVFNGQSIEGSVVNTESPGAISLFDQEHRRRERARARANDALLKYHRDLGLNFLFLRIRISIGLDVDWG